ncbi:hypothetical protein BJX99DRAFT_235446 [Aspergillus californicus]
MGLSPCAALRSGLYYRIILTMDGFFCIASPGTIGTCTLIQETRLCKTRKSPPRFLSRSAFLHQPELKLVYSPAPMQDKVGTRWVLYPTICISTSRKWCRE